MAPALKNDIYMVWGAFLHYLWLDGEIVTASRSSRKQQLAKKQLLAVAAIIANKKKMAT